MKNTNYKNSPYRTSTGRKLKKSQRRIVRLTLAAANN